MKLSWRDIVTTLLVLSGGAIVYAKFYDYTWAVIGSWRSAVAVIAGIGLLMFAFSRFEFSDRSFLNSSEMVLGVGALGLAIAGMIVASEVIFYVLAGVLGAFWLVNTSRHIRNSSVDEESTSFHRPASVH